MRDACCHRQPCLRHGTRDVRGDGEALTIVSRSLHLLTLISPGWRFRRWVVPVITDPLMFPSNMADGETVGVCVIGHPDAYSAMTMLSSSGMICLGAWRPGLARSCQTSWPSDSNIFLFPYASNSHVTQFLFSFLQLYHWYTWTLVCFVHYIYHMMPYSACVLLFQQTEDGEPWT